MSLQRSVAVGLLTALLVPAAGFGGLAGKPLSKREFQRRGNAICRAWDRKVAAIPVDTTSKTPSARMMTQWVALVNDQYKQLARLTPPAAYARAFKNMLVAAKPIASLGWDYAAALRAGDRQRAAQLDTKGRQAADEFKRLATSLGLTACATE